MDEYVEKYLIDVRGLVINHIPKLKNEVEKILSNKM
jgi:hypothetical protein